uniref:Uncharacterized protein n=1 Tax=Panagrolaimus davidi TaxID=227884 RepID=A0A914QH41_9BILA
MEVEDALEHHHQEIITPSSCPNPSCSSLPSKSSATLKSPEGLSKSGYYKRKKQFEQMANEVLGPGHKIVIGRPQRVTVEEAAEYYVLHGCKDAQYAGLDRRFYPCLTTVKKYLKKLRENLTSLARDGLAAAILNDLDSLDDFPFHNARVNIGTDKGKDTSKIVWTFVDKEDPQSTKKLRVYKVFVGNDNRENLLPHLILVDEAVKYLQSKVFNTKHGPKTFTCFFIADCKAGSECAGIQGGRPTCPCVYCKVPSSKWKTLQSIPDSELRTIEELVESGEKIAAAEADGTKTPAQIAQLKKNLNSVKAVPMMRNILLKRFVPPVVHIGITAVSSAVKYCRKNGKGPELLAAIESMGVKTHQGTSDFTGPNCRKILKFFSEHPEIDGFAIDLLRAYAKIEKFAVARDLTEEEINSMDLAIKEYFDIMDSRYPDFAGAKVKLHILRFHVMPFVREFKSWGKFSEQGKLTQENTLTNNSVTALEGIHKVKNQTDLRIKSGDDNAKIEYFMAMQLLFLS